MTTLYIAMEGGICQSVSSDDPALVGLKVVIIDYDSEGASNDEITGVKQPDGEIVEAVIGVDFVGQVAVELVP